MTRRTALFSGIASALPRFALLAAALLAPLVAMQSVQAGADAFIEDSRKLSSGAGLVLVISLQRG
ncbi:MAG: hypothetical protein DCC69_04880 [Hyphomicrobiales bacterium]|nr:MAG: hypothetical protein DCC69_04880 [Hyphomicrobiales bacterium]